MRLVPFLLSSEFLVRLLRDLSTSEPPTSLSAVWTDCSAALALHTGSNRLTSRDLWMAASGLSPRISAENYGAIRDQAARPTHPVAAPSGLQATARRLEPDCWIRPAVQKPIQVEARFRLTRTPGGLLSEGKDQHGRVAAGSPNHQRRRGASSGARLSDSSPASEAHTGPRRWLQP